MIRANEEFKEQDDKQKLTRMLIDFIQYNRPDKYRAKIPGYELVLNLVTVNKNMAKKILKVKQNNDEGMQSVGGASGITSMLSRQKPEKHMSFSN